MAMVKCPKCGQEVSERATKCVHCGLMLKSNNKERLNKSPQALYDEACEHYKQLTLIVRRLGLILESSDKIRYSTTIALQQMDLILQFLLLIQANSDGEVDHLEQQFIDKITTHSDLLGLLNSKFGTNFSWDSLEWQNKKSIVVILIGMVKDISELTSDFIDGIALVDAATTDHDYYADIRKCFLNIAECLACVDKDSNDNQGDKLFDDYFGKYYLEKKKEFEKQICN